MSGVAMACAWPLSARRISSTPAVRLPHWSEPAELQRDAVVAVEVEEVQRLEQHVAELRVADPRFEPALHDVARQHPVDREVLADVAQEVDRRQARGPVVVVDHRRGVVALEGQERLNLTERTRSTQSLTVSRLLSVRSPSPWDRRSCRSRRRPGRTACGRRPGAASRSAPGPGGPCAGSALSGRSRRRTARSHRSGPRAARRGPSSWRSGRATRGRRGGWIDGHGEPFGSECAGQACHGPI